MPSGVYERASLENRLLNKRSIDPTSNCWIWTGAKGPFGYGHIGSNGKTLSAHRAAFEIFRGVIPLDLQVLHSCDRPSCFNPDHLFLGTNLENRRDSVLKNRQAKGATCGKLTESQVNEIRHRIHAGEPQKKIASHFNVSQQHVSRIKNNFRGKEEL